MNDDWRQTATCRTPLSCDHLVLNVYPPDQIVLYLRICCATSHCVSALAWLLLPSVVKLYAAIWYNRNPWLHTWYPLPCETKSWNSKNESPIVHTYQQCIKAMTSVDKTLEVWLVLTTQTSNIVLWRDRSVNILEVPFMIWNPIQIMQYLLHRTS